MALTACDATLRLLANDESVCVIKRTIRSLDVNAIVDGAGDPEISAKLQAGVATNLKRYANHTATDWFSAKVEDPYWILDTVEFKTAWHPIGI